MKLIIFLLAFATAVFASGECKADTDLVFMDSDKVPKYGQFSCHCDDGSYVEIAFDKQLTEIVKVVRPGYASGLERTITAYKRNDKTAETLMAEIEYDDLGVVKSSRGEALDISIIRDVYNSIRNEFTFSVR